MVFAVKLKSVVDTPVDRFRVSVVADVYNWQQLVCVTCPLLRSVWCEHCFRGLILPVFYFSLITGLYLGNVQHSSISPMICNTDALRVLLWLNVLSFNDHLADFNLRKCRKDLQNIPTDKVYSKSEKGFI